MNKMNPLFAMLPPEVLRKAKALADQAHAEEKIRELVGARIFLLVPAIFFLLLVSGANGLTFAAFASTLPPTGIPWLKKALGIFALVVIVGGTFAMFNVLLAWLELSALQGSDLPAQEKRLYHQTTWVPLVLLVLIPALINAWFSFLFLVAAVSLLLLVLLFTY